MSEPIFKRIRIAHWSWWFGATLALIFVFVTLRFGLPIYQKHKFIAEVRARGVELKVKNEPNWFPSWLGDDWKATLGSIVVIDARLDNKFADEDLRYVAECCELEALVFYGCQVTDQGLFNLKGLTKLRYLSLAGCQITDDGLIQLKGLANLESLHLNRIYITDTPITDAALVHLFGLSKLEDLGLVDTQITDAGLAMLEQMSQLKYVTVYRTNVTHDGVINFKKARFGCKIVDEDPM